MNLRTLLAGILLLSVSNNLCLSTEAADTKYRKSQRTDGLACVYVQAPEELRGFIPKSWDAIACEYGDLYANRSNDAVLLLELNSSGTIDSVEDRKLLIVRREGNGSLVKELEVTDAVPVHIGPNFGQPTLKIDKGNIVISEFGGGRERGRETYTYALDKGSWRLVHYYSDCLDKLGDGEPKTALHVDFKTGRVTGTLSKRGVPVVKRLDIYDVFSVKAKEELKTTAPSGEWEAPCLVLNRKECVSGNGAANWKDPSDLSVKVQSIHDTKVLFVSIDVMDNYVQDGDRVTMLGRFAKVIEPVERSRTIQPGGYREILRFDLTAEPFAGYFEFAGPKDNIFFPFTLTVADKDRGFKSEKKISTALGAREVKAEGGLLILRTQEIPGLENINVREGTIHQTVVYLPECPD